MKYDKIVIEKLSCIEFIRNEDSIILADNLRNRRYIINECAYDMCCFIDGTRTLRDIAVKISETYEVPVKEIEEDVYSLYQFLKTNKLILTKNSVSYVTAFLFQKITRY